jgi:hypothetical protein
MTYEPLDDYEVAATGNLGLSPKQKQLRLGKFTASTVEALLKPKGIGAAGLTYIYKKEAEIKTGLIDDMPLTPEMQWGIEYEQQALDLIGLQKNDDVYFDDYVNLCGTPDALGAEIKCPKSHTHCEYMRMKTAEDLKAVEPIYYWQIMSYMHLTGLKEWLFVSYDPRMLDVNNKIFKLVIDYNKKEIEFLLTRLEEAFKILKNEK